MKQSAIQIIDELMERYPALQCCENEIREAAQALVLCFESGGKLLACGNGGSAADCEHIVGELMKAFRLKRELEPQKCEQIRRLFPDEAEKLIPNLQRAVPAISLVSQTALMTAFGNDVSAEMLFAQQVLSYGTQGDILLAISTSGNSRNVLDAARIARVQNMTVIGLTNAQGGKLKALSDIVICVPETVTFKVQELHLPVYHCLCACVEDELFGCGI